MPVLKILIAAGVFPPAVGGPSTHLAQIIPHLLNRGHDLRAVAFGERDDSSDGVPVVRISGAHWAARNRQYADAYRRHAAWADVIYVTSGGLPRRGIRRPTILRIPGDRAWERAVNRGLVPATEDIDRFQRATHGIRVSLLTWMQRREARTADRVVVPSGYLRNIVAGWGVDPARIAVVHSAAEPFEAPASRDHLRQRLGWIDDVVEMVAPARLVAWKGIDLLIDATATVPGVRLTVLGDGPQRQALEARARDRRAPVAFLGDRPRDEVRTYMHAADYCVVYSGYEGLSHTLLESLSAGTPVIASRRGGNPEIVTHGVNGLLVDHPDVQALATTLVRACDPLVRARLRAGAIVPLDRFSAQTAAEGICMQLERLAATR